jgi:hypothetical protein
MTPSLPRSMPPSALFRTMSFSSHTVASIAGIAFNVARLDPWTAARLPATSTMTLTPLPMSRLITTPVCTRLERSSSACTVRPNPPTSITSSPLGRTSLSSLPKPRPASMILRRTSSERSFELAFAIQDDKVAAGSFGLANAPRRPLDGLANCVR